MDKKLFEKIFAEHKELGRFITNLSIDFSKYVKLQKFVECREIKKGVWIFDLAYLKSELNSGFSKEIIDDIEDLEFLSTGLCGNCSCLQFHVDVLAHAHHALSSHTDLSSEALCEGWMRGLVTKENCESCRGQLCFAKCCKAQDFRFCKDKEAIDKHRILSKGKNISLSDCVSIKNKLLNRGSCDFNKTYIIYISENTILNEPIAIDELINAEGCYEKVIFLAKANSRVTVYEKHTVSESFFLRSFHGYLQEGANVTFIQDTELENSYTLQDYIWNLDNDAHLSLIDGFTGGTATRGIGTPGTSSLSTGLLGAGTPGIDSSGNFNFKTKKFNLNGAHAAVNQVCVSALKNNEQAALISEQNHLAQNTSSSIYINNCLFGRSKMFYKGVIKIEEKANKSQAEQYSKSLLLSSDVNDCSIPSLEVKTDDVKCKHGSAATHISDLDKWYLLSKGIDADRASSLIIEGFISNNSLMQSHKVMLAPMIKRLLSCDNQ